MVTFYFDTKVNSLSRVGDCRNVNEEEFDEVISSIPIDMFFKALDSTPSAIINAISQLRFRGIMLVYATLDAKDIFPDNRIYLHSTISGRMTNFNNRSPFQIQDKERTFVVMEYRDTPGGELRSKSDDELYALAKQEIHTITQVKESKITDFKIIRLPHGYPILIDGYMEFLDEVQKYSKSLDDLQLIGRSGSFKYNNQDHSLYM
jgi:protoporphyrinogen oxidase